MAARALVEVLPTNRLAELNEIFPGLEGLRIVAERLLQRLSLDEGIRLVARASQLDDVLTWIVEQLVRDAQPTAWSAERVEALMTAFGGHSGGRSPDPDLLAAVFARHPQAALNAVRVSPFQGRHWGPSAQLLPLSRMDLSLLDGDDHAALRDAVAFEVEHQKGIQEQQQGPETQRARLAAVLDRDGLDVDPYGIEGAYRLRELDDRHQVTLLALVDRWWPPAGFERGENDWLPASTRAVLTIGGELKPPLDEKRWRTLVDAHLTARSWREHELAGDHVNSWLRTARPATGHKHLRAKLEATSDPETIAKIVTISGCDGALRELALDRLAVLSPKDGRWLGTVGFLIETGDAGRGRELLELPMPGPTRRGLLTRLARRGDSSAQLAEIRRLEAELRAGTTKPTRESTAAVTVDFSERLPHWRDIEVTAELRRALVKLARAAADHQDKELFDFAVATIGSTPDVEGLTALTELADAYGTSRPGLVLSVEGMARRIATAKVLRRLPESLAEVAADFEERFGEKRPETTPAPGSLCVDTRVRTTKAGRIVCSPDRDGASDAPC